MNKTNTVLRTLLAALLPALSVLSGRAAGLSERLQVNVRAGYHVGGTAPMGLPATIRSIDAFHLTPNVTVGADVNVALGGRWGVATGLHFGNKGMDGEVTTKGYHMRLRMDDSELEGFFTGSVRQKVTQWMLTLPLQATWRPGSRVLLRCGPYLSWLTSADFSGHAAGGYLRVDDPTGAKVEMGSSSDEWATYDFTDDLRRLQAGIGAGADWQLQRRLGLSVDLAWGLTRLHHSSFKTIEDPLYPVYGTVSIFYRLK